MKMILKSKIKQVISCISILSCLSFIICMTVHATSEDIRVASVSIYDDYGSSSGSTLLIGESIYLKSSIYPTTATNRSVIWSTSNASVAKVNNGVVTSQKKGSAVISATSVDGNFNATYAITVVDENATYTYNGTTYNYVWEKGSWGSNVKWYYCVGKKLIITGSGDMKEPNFSSDLPWYHLDPLVVKIQEGITSLCYGALEGFRHADTLYLPSTLTKIGKNAFYVFGPQTTVSGVTYFNGRTYYGGTPEQYNQIEFGYHPFGGLPYEITDYCRANGHIETVTSPILPTCRSYGKTIGVHCVKCEKEIVKSSSIDYIDCTYENGYCTMCGKADPTIYVTSVNIPQNSFVIALNTSIPVVADITPSNATNKKINWTSSNPEIATVSSYGTVTGKALGRVTITASSEDGGKSDTCIVTVVDPTISVTGVYLDKTKLDLLVNEKETLHATVLPTNATNQNVIWYSSNESVATVSEGIVTAIATGTAIITVETQDGKINASSNLTVTCNHIYSNVCDTICNSCGEVRDVEPHRYKNNGSDNSYHWKYCDCGEISEKQEHEYNLINNEEQHWYECSCGKEKPESRYGHSYSRCVDTDYHWLMCFCGHIIDKEKHDYTEASCKTPMTCKECWETKGEALGHIYDNNADTNCNKCGHIREVKNGWIKEYGKWAYYEDGEKLKNCWKLDSVGWCYLGSDGYMRTNAWIMDSQGWCYVGADGYCVTNAWMLDSVGWCYLNAEGRMATNSWILDSVGWCYVGADGYCVTNAWMKDSHGWCYLDAEGRMATNRWVMDSVGWCYVGADGYAVTNYWKQDSVGWCYLNSEGSMTKNAWVYDGGWYYLDGNGYMIFNTSRYIGGKVYNFNYSGLCTNP